MKPWYALFLGLPYYIMIANPSQAQISLDRTTNTTLTPTDNGIRIDEGNRARDNLFHSFKEFSIPNGSEAFFNNANDIVNIFSRVTGGNISNIDGLIRANGTANLFLINPAGIIFGENASLDIGGSFLGSTALSIVFDDNVEFLATDSDNPPLLTINMPIGLNFGNNPGVIAVNGSNLQVNNGEALALLGGNVTITGGEIAAPGGRVELGGVAQQGQVSLNQQQSGKFGGMNSISFPVGVARADVTLTNAAEVDVRAGGGGSIGVNARNLEISGGELGRSNLRAGIAPESDSPSAQAGDITLNATDNITVSQESRITNQVEESGFGNSGGINITTANLSLRGGVRVSASTFGQGNAGKITINASETISAQGESQAGFRSSIFNSVAPTGVGNTGGIEITTTNLSLRGGGLVSASTEGQGNAGAITINASGTISVDGESQDGFASGIFSQVGPEAIGNSGGIEITTANLSLREGGLVSANTFGTGNAAAITINASGTISAQGERQNGLPSAIGNVVVAEGDSNGINITTTNLSLREGGQVSANTFGKGNAGAITINASGIISAQGETQDGRFNSGIFSLVAGTGVGDAGGIEITTTNLSLTQAGQVNASTLGTGKAGEITINASGIILAQGESPDGTNSGIFSFVSSTGEGDSDGINITTTDLFLREGGQVTASTSGTGNGGDITINVSDTIRADGENPDGGNHGIFSIVRPSGEGDAGEIEINATNLFLREGGAVSAITLGTGNGGDITINVSDTISAQGEPQNRIFFPSGIFSSVGESGEGDAGEIEINTTNLSLRGGGIVGASTFGQGDGGVITINATDTISAQGESLDGIFPSGIISRVEESGRGDAADININTNNLFLSKGAEISVESLGQGEARNLFIQANSLALDSGATLSASTPVGTGGAVTLQIADDLTLRDNSTISARAIEDADGGNIAIDAEFVIAFPNQNNDIIASAEEGIGGEINITTLAIFGLEERSSTPPNNTNDIDASSDFGLDGEVDINELEVNPAQALEELPTEVVDVARLVAQNLCQQGKGSEFIVTGKGGLAPSPTQARNGEISEVDLVEPATFLRDEEVSQVEEVKGAESEIIEAQGWIINERGNLELVAYKTNINDINGSPVQPKDAKTCHKY